MLLPGETAEQMMTEETAWSFLSRWGLDADNSEVIRRAVYTFRSLIAPSFRDRRVLLIGDAAHPDATLHGPGHVLGYPGRREPRLETRPGAGGVSEADLLDTYTEERFPHVDQIIKTSMALGQIVCISDPAAAAERDAALLSGQAPPPPPFPWLTAGVRAREDRGRSRGRGGRPTRRPGRLATADSTARADDLLGNTWHILTDDASIAEAVTHSHGELVRRLGGRIAHVSRARRSADSLVDIDATYHSWFRDGGFRAVVVPPRLLRLRHRHLGRGTRRTVGPVAQQLSVQSAQAPALS